MTRKHIWFLTILLAIAQQAWAWDGSGTSADPYLIKTSADWKQLANDVGGGNSYSGKFFEMTADIDAQGISVGASDKPFSGTFSGGMHTLTYNRGTKDDTNGVQPVDDYCAPFVRLEGATIRHLRVKGEVYSSHMHAAGIASLIDGSQPTTISNCHVSSVLFAAKNLTEDASFGGLAGEVLSTCKASPVVTGSSFTGKLDGWCTSSGGLVAFTSSQGITFEHCMFDPQNIAYIQGTPATFVRMAPGVKSTFKECYYTQVFGTQQGEAVFSGVTTDNDCTYEMVTEPTIDFDGHKYYQNGAQIRLTVPEGKAFAHWTTGGSCYISDPWQRDGIMEIRDVRRKPYFIYYATPIKAKQERTMDGTKYRYLSSDDYHLYLSDELCAKKGYYLDEDHWLVKMVGSTKVYVTAVTGWEPGKIPSDGAQIHNDLAGYFNDHTLTACIAPHAFEGCTELKTLYFKDTDAAAYDAATQFDFTIGDYAFANCPNLTEVKMMQYTTKGTNHWEALKPGQVSSIASTVFEKSPNANFSTDASQYQAYMGSETWAALRKNIIVYNHTFENQGFSEYGAKYIHMYNTAGDALKNNDDGNKAVLEQIRLWNSDYEQFNAASLLTASTENIWYTQINGADDSYLSGHDGVMRIYNDPGSYYNYKNIAVRTLGESKEVKAIEFYQTNGRSSNSYTEPKIVIQNGAFKNCTNLKELRMFYYVQDGEDRWTALGPTDVIPGNNIFGLRQYTDKEIRDALDNETPLGSDSDPKIPAGFKILVSPDLYSDYLDNPNWQPYLGFIEPVEYSPSTKNDITKGGLTYGFMTNPGGIMQTSQTVSQDVSWWTAPRIAIEVAMMAWSIYKAATTPTNAAVNQLRDAEAPLFNNFNEAGNVLKKAKDVLSDFKQIAGKIDDLMAAEGHHAADYIPVISELNDKTLEELFIDVNSQAKSILASQGLLSNDGLRLVLTKGVLAKKSDVVLEYLGIPFKQILDNAIKEQAKVITAKTSLYNASGQALQAAVAKTGSAQLLQYLNPLTAKGLAAAALSTSTAGLLASKYWGGSGTYDGDLLQKGMRANILSNIHQVGLVGGGYVITTPSKNIIYHTYIKNVADTQEDAVIYAGFDDDNNSYTSDRTMTFAKNAFRNHKNLKTVSFHALEGQTSNAALPMLLTIPDSAFVGCDNLVELNLLLKDNESGTRALGPENFILAGDSIFAGLDSLKFHIVIDPSRKDDFLANESWAPLKRFFKYEEAVPTVKYNVYGGQYAYAYENNSIKREHKVSGHLIEHTEVIGADNTFLDEHQGALKLCNDIGTFNNYQIDAVRRKAFKGNEHLRRVNFTDLYGASAWGDSYTGLEMELGDSCFANCKNLVSLDMLYLVTDGTNHVDPIKPEWVGIGKGVLDGTNAKIKMMPQQVEWFLADSSWVAYKDRFTPCIIRPTDEALCKALSFGAYYDRANTGMDPALWKDYIDLSLIKEMGYDNLKTVISPYAGDILSFADFKYFESVGLDYVGEEWFRGCSKLSNIVLPSTIKTIGKNAFASCAALKEMEIPATVTKINEGAFNGCTGLNVILVRNTVPAELGSNAFTKNEGLKIYVPAASLNDYLTKWTEYKDYIVSDASYKINKVVALTKTGTLAEKLGLTVEWDFSGANAGDEPRYLHGNYAKYDSLTISGPLNTLDLWVIRYLAGNNGYERGGMATDGKLKYLNLYGAKISGESCGANYLNLSTYTSDGWHQVKDDDELPHYLFYHCTALETVILPKSIKTVGASVFMGATALKRIAITGDDKSFDGKIMYFRATLLNNPIEELVLVTKARTQGENSLPWGSSIENVYTTQAQLGLYANEPKLIEQAKSITAAFEDDKVWLQLVNSGHFFPSEFLELEDVGTIFSEYGKWDTEYADNLYKFNDFANFHNVKELHGTFNTCLNLTEVTLPASVKLIAEDAFSNCKDLRKLTLLSDSVPEITGDPFKDLPSDYVIYVPRNVVKVYRTKWPQYAKHINPSATSAGISNVIEVNLKEANTLADALGLKSVYSTDWDKLACNVLSSLRGDYSHITRLKVNGPIGAADFDLLRYLAGYCPWTSTRNYSGKLEYLDLYDARITKDSNYGLHSYYRRWDGTETPTTTSVDDDVLPGHAFLRAYNLKTLILPKTCKKVNARALQECEGLETLVVGDDIEDFNWNALDDNASLTRMYILAKEKMNISTEFPIWRWLCNNYNPTFDAFYVRPSLYQDYLRDDAYTGSSWQRTNNVSKGAFEDDDAFAAFACHGTATADELATVTSVEGWFDTHTGVKDLSPLQYTVIDTLKTATLAPLTKLENVSLPLTLEYMEDGLFEKAKNLRYVDMMLCDSTSIVSKLRDGGLKRLGINSQQTLAYVPGTYGESDETNVIVNLGGVLKAKTYSIVDSLDYVVPYAFKADKIENTRKLVASKVPYTVCLPYSMTLPRGAAAAYKLSQRDGNKLVFEEIPNSEELQAMHPYLLIVNEDLDVENYAFSLDSKSGAAQTIPASTDLRTEQDDAPGYSIRGTFRHIGNSEAADLGAYVLRNDGDWHPVTTANTKGEILPFRAYLLPSARNAGARIRMSLAGNGNTTDIDTIETVDRDGTHTYYDLQGRRIEPDNAKGVVIKDGRKIVVK